MRVGNQLIERIQASGDESPGAFNLAADLVTILSHEASLWTNRADDATRIPDMLADVARYLEQAARDAIA
jgi:hypothetical protein